MKLTVVLITCLSLIAGSGGQIVRQYQPFSCQRINSPCVANNGGQCLADGTCRCVDPAFRGHNCGLRISTIRSPQNCAVNCENSGTCFNNGAGDQCYCPPAMYGAVCNLARVAILGCNERTMTVLVNPHQSNVFSGRIYVRGLEAAPACNLNIAATAPYEGFVKTLSLNTTGGVVNPCASALQTLDNGRIKRYAVVVQHDPELISWPDEIHTFQCSQTATGTFIGFVINGVAFNTQTDGQLTGININSIHLPLNIDITRQPDRSRLATSVLMVGDDLYLEVSLTDQSAFSTIRVDSVSAADSDVNPRATKQLIQNGCPVSTTNGITVSNPQRPSSNTVLIPFKMFKFLTSSSVHFFASTTICSDADLANCNPTLCNGANTGFGRKRRQAEGVPERANATTHVFVITPGDTTVAQSSCVTDDVTRSEYPSCFQNSAFLIVVIVFGILLLIALLMLGMVCFRFRQTKNKD